MSSQGRRWLASAPRGDDGLSVMEVVVAMTIIGAVMAAATLFFVNGLKSASAQSARQTAVSLANQAIENASSFSPGALLTGRRASDIATLMATPGASSITAQDQTSSGNTDASPNATGMAIQTTANPAPVVNGITFTVRTFIDVCWLTGSISGGSCTPTKTSTTTQLFRVSVDVSYPVSGGVGCFGYAPTQCDYTTATLIDPTSDPSFNSNISRPTVSAVSVASVLVSTTTPVTLTGTNFNNGATVSISSGGGVAGSITLLSATSLTFNLTAGSTVGTYVLTVLNPDGGRTTTSIVISGPPKITSITPASVNIGSTVTLTINGTGFQNGASLTVDSGGTLSNAVIVASTKATVTFASNGTNPGTRTITLTNPDTGSDAGTFIVRQVTVTAISPTSVRCGASATSLTITGTGFSSGASVSDGVDSFGSATITGTTKAVVTITPSATSAGSRTVTVTNLDGSSGSMSYTVLACPPTISDVNAKSLTRANPTTTTITGTNFVAGAVATITSGGSTVISQPVTFADSTKVSFNWNTTIYSKGTYSITVTVTNPDGQSDDFPMTLTLK